MSKPPVIRLAAAAPAPGRDEIEQLVDAAADARRVLAERSLRRIPHVLLKYRPELRVLFIGRDEEGDYRPLGVSADPGLSNPQEADLLDEYEKTEIAAGREGELSGLVSWLTGYEAAFYPYTLHHSRISSCYSLDLHALSRALVERQAVGWWSVIGTWRHAPEGAAQAWTEVVHADSAEAAAALAEQLKRSDLPGIFDLDPDELALVQPATYAVFAGAVPSAYTDA